MARKPTKYAHVVDKLPKFSNIEPERRDIVNVVKTAILEPPGEALDDPWALEKENGIRVSAEIIKGLDAQMKTLLMLKKRATAGRPWASEFARVYAELRDLDDTIKEWCSSLNLLLEVYTELMCDQLEVEGMSGVRLENGRPISTWKEPHAVVSDRQKFRLWCIKNGFEESLALPWPTTNATVKALLLKGEPEPDGVTTYSETKVRLGSE